MASHSATTASTRGRPKAISREMLQESAFELFLELGYANTTIGEITRRAGVSRNTFFNYFSSKSDVFWTELDDAVAAACEGLAAETTPGDALASVRQNLLDAGTRFGPGQVPWALTQYALIGATAELQTSAVTSLTSLAAAVEDHLSAHAAPDTARLARPAAYAIVAAAVAAARTWAAAGTTRGSFTPYLDEAITPVCTAFATVGDR